MTRTKVQIDTKRMPDEWTLEDAVAQFEAIQSSMEWRKTYGRPFDAMALIARALLATWEVAENPPAAKRRKELEALIISLTSDWDTMRGLPISWRSLEHRGMLAIVAWAIKMLSEALRKPGK